jgi:hypothetical protein
MGLVSAALIVVNPVRWLGRLPSAPKSAARSDTSLETA